MRKVVLFMSVSVDGFISGPDGDLGWHRVDEEVHEHFNAVLSQMGGFLDGRRTWQLMADYWPGADDDPDAPAPVAEFARIWREMPKVVFSRTLTDAGWNTTVAREVSTASIRALCAEPGGDLALGGAELARSFLALDLVDELRLYVHPVLVGRGARLFTEPDLIRDLTLLESRAFGNGVVLLGYGRDQPA
ncbi:dihydrofolate reductase family protein [Nocardioides sp. MAHUQ-72]|uniref:dihydrofolate reductase family protein n=1 Tax=unclassified Nocardioides TaxID=2615069 RepID=UPI00361B7AF4